MNKQTFRSFFPFFRQKLRNIPPVIHKGTTKKCWSDEEPALLNQAIIFRTPPLKGSAMEHLLAFVYIHTMNRCGGRHTLQGVVEIPVLTVISVNLINRRHVGTCLNAYLGG